MKHGLVLLISLYQQTLSVAVRSIFGSSICRFSPSCSEYAKRSIVEYGALKGIYMSTRRLLSCQPFTI